MCIVYNTRENEDQKCFFRDLSIRTLLKIKDKQGAKALVKNIILEESLEGFHKVLNQMTVGEIENFFEALLKNLGLKERGSEDPEYDQRILLYSLCSLMHFHHLKREELYDQRAYATDDTNKAPWNPTEAKEKDQGWWRALGVSEGEIWGVELIILLLQKSAKRSW